MYRYTVEGGGRPSGALYRVGGDLKILREGEQGTTQRRHGPSPVSRATAASAAGYRCFCYTNLRVALGFRSRGNPFAKKYARTHTRRAAGASPGRHFDCTFDERLAPT